MSGVNSSNDKTQIASLESNIRTPKSVNKLNLVGKKISDRYLVEELIGQGGMCYIYRARDLFLESASRPEVFVAIKVLLEEFSNSEDAISLLKDETTKTQQLSHPNIVKVYSAGFDKGLHYVTMELVEGETLEQIIKRNKPSGMIFKKANVILNQLADALIYAHARGVIHNDLKPSNIIFDSNGSLKVLDFGIAKHKTIEDAYAVKSESTSGAIGGYTPTYASPEQLKGAAASVKDDVFSYACIALELLSSKHPYNRVAADTLPKDTSVRRPSNCPLWLWSSLSEAISLDAAKRTGSLKPILAKLQSNFKPAIAIVASTVVLAFLASQYFLTNTNNIKQLEAKLDNAKAINQQVETWMSWSGPEILNKLSEIPPQYEVLKQGLLRANQENILQSFDYRANQINTIANKFKDFDETINVYSKALEYYPDSEKLSVQLESILRERQSIISDITSRIDLLLEQSRYSELDNNSIPQLINDLNTVDSTYVYRPSAVHFDNYKLALDKAIEEDDVITQRSLLDVGKVIFTNNQKNELGFADLLKRESAIDALTFYQEKINLGEEADFPTEDAIVFYGPRFDRYTKKLEAIEEYKELLNFEELINTESAALPKDFSLLVSLKQELSRRYITMANTLMKRKMYRTAEQLVERSEAITQSLDNVML
ncbi:protein kinase [Pseudoalteromonas sp. MMG006]|uniref:serine/threonine-protein kinase n=1 Tax=Pseudoalteromonas sp. MMG006 TaxID=2822683 RepID=UPI001B396051|nr:serine/threonine-protein kinase [Pseudoalteromonas sp. MMG006]MBQ4800064.1 protein kinase [Pseudoalteromonas sp. MMG006]